MHDMMQLFMLYFMHKIIHLISVREVYNFLVNAGAELNLFQSIYYLKRHVPDFFQICPSGVPLLKSQMTK